MIPYYSRVAAIDDDEMHLKAISWGLSLAGFCPLPFWFDDGELESVPTVPVAGVRIVFTDIHLVDGNITNLKIHSAAIIKCLKAIVGTGPYALIFWSMHAGDVAKMTTLIEEDGPGAGLNTPIGYGSIDKRKVLAATDDEASAANTQVFDSQALRDAIMMQLESFPTLATATSWEMRAAEAAAKTNDSLFRLTDPTLKPAKRTAQWEGLLAYLASEAVGRQAAAHDVDAALDAALLPILEDQLGFVGAPENATPPSSQSLQALLNVGTRPKLPKAISRGRLNASYLIDEVGAASKKGVFERGMVIRLNKGFIESGELERRFGFGERDLLIREFMCTPSPTEADIDSLLPLHLLELGPECDHVQVKVSTHRYLLCILAPTEKVSLCQRSHEGRVYSLHNDSIVDGGCIAFADQPTANFHLLVSTRCFTSLPPRGPMDGECRFRLRRISLEEVMHRYTSHVRRPGVMRF